MCSTLMKIVSYKDLENEHKSKIKLAQNKYIEDLNNLKTEFEKNVIICKEADTIFNTSDNNDVACIENCTIMHVQGQKVYSSKQMPI